MRTSIDLRAGLLASLTLCAACATNPVTGERQLSLISESQEIEMGRQGAESVRQSIGLVDDAALQSYVTRVGQTLARDSERPGLPWSFGVVDDPVPNAFAFPGGFIFVTRGMMNLMRNEAELAAVLGHEIGHVTAKHSVTMLSRQQLTGLALGVGMILAPDLAQFGDVAGAGLSLLFLKYGRDAERQADDLGYRYSLTHGYDVREMVNVFAQLQRVGEASGQSPLPAWMASHPYPEERIQRIQGMLAQDQLPASLTIGTETFMARIDGLIYGSNPRHGFFDGSLFLHPDLRFRIRFPQGWQTQNMTQAVLAGSPQQDAIMQLTLAQGTADNAASQFFGQQGLESGNVGRTTINGLSAVIGEFQAQTQQGTVRGTAAFITLGSNTYQVLAYGTPQGYASSQNAMRSAIGSFDRLTDPAALDRQPNRIDTIRITSAMTLAEFHRRYPSVVELSELALINQLSGGSDRVASGTWMKRVVGG